MKKFLVLLILVAAIAFGVREWKKKHQVTAQQSPQSTAVVAGSLAGPAPKAAAGQAKADAAPALEVAKPAAEHKAAPVIIDTSAQVVVFCYHRVEGKAGGDLSMTPELFEEQMQTLKDNGISVISMQDFLAWKRSEKNIPARSALITIDDGYASAYEVARPILKKFNYPWTYFIYTKYVNSGGKSITWKQLEELRDEGVEIGSHTVSHMDLRLPLGKNPEAYDQWLREEIIGSRKIIEQKLGINCATFAYPLGRQNQKVIGVVKDAGYEAAFSVYGQRNTHAGNHLLVGRYAYYAKRPQDMKQAFDFNGPVTASSEETPENSAMAGSMMITQPMEGEVVRELQPVLKANVSTLGDLDPKSIVVRLSGVGPVPFTYNGDSTTVEAKPAKPLKPGEYTVILSGVAEGKKLETQWHFKVDPKAAN
jgi:peptidoglycan/xylan/chitin deacetylase (PgdA/CDA1 family)